MAASPSDMVLRARVEVVKSLWRRSGVNRKGMLVDMGWFSLVELEVFDGDSRTDVCRLYVKAGRGGGGAWLSDLSVSSVLGVSDSA